MRPERDYYEVLEVPRDADASTIKRSFLKKARKLHPDVSTEPDAEIRFKEVNEAYAVLSDEQKRANYDRFGDAEGPGGFGGGYADMSDIFSGGFGFSDILDSFFGVGSQAAGGSARSAGRNMSIKLTLTLEEAASGVAKTLVYNRLAPCEDCGGSGVAEGGTETTCSRCKGTGRITEVTRTMFGRMQSQTACPSCNGSGRIVSKPCESCQGQGRTPSREKVEVTIEPGAFAGQRIEVSGKGEAGLRGMPAGNLLVSIDIAPHQRFERLSDDLHFALEIDGIEAMVGCTKTVAGILKGEEISIKVPAGIQFADTVCKEDCGMPRLHSSERGDLIAHIQIRTPQDLTKKERSELKKIASERARREHAPVTS